MNLIEADGKALLRRHGLPVPRGMLLAPDAKKFESRYRKKGRSQTGVGRPEFNVLSVEPRSAMRGALLLFKLGGGARLRGANSKSVLQTVSLLRFEFFDHEQCYCES